MATNLAVNETSVSSMLVHVNITIEGIGISRRLVPTNLVEKYISVS